MRQTTGLLLSITIIVAAGCGRSASGDQWTTSVDTLPDGTVVVVNMPPEGGARSSWTIVEELRIGSVDEPGATTFGQVKGLAILEDGGIAVLDAQAQDIRVFDAHGAHVATFGGSGEGPGELRGAWGLMLSPDGQLYVPDHRNQRMSVFDPAAGFVSSYRVHYPRYGFVWDGVMAEDARILEPSMSMGPERRDIVRVFSSTMEIVDTLPLPAPPPIDQKNPPGAFYWEAPDGRAMGYISVPFYAQTQRLLDPRGAIWWSEQGTPGYRIKRWIPGGDTTLVVETHRAPVAVTQAERDSAIESIRTTLLERGAARQDWSKIPAAKPGVLSLFLAENGDLWVETSSPDTRKLFDVYAYDGRHTGTAATSLKLWRWVKPIVQGDRFWAVVTDEFDVPYVVRARIVPASSAQ